MVSLGITEFSIGHTLGATNTLISLAASVIYGLPACCGAHCVMLVAAQLFVPDCTDPLDLAIYDYTAYMNYMHDSVRHRPINLIIPRDNSEVDTWLNVYNFLKMTVLPLKLRHGWVFTFHRNYVKQVFLLLYPVSRIRGIGIIFVIWSPSSTCNMVLYV